MIWIVCLFSRKKPNLPNSSIDAEIVWNFHQQRNTPCWYPKMTEMLKFALYCPCKLHLNVVKGFSITIFEDDLVQVRNKSPGAVDNGSCPPSCWYAFFLPCHWCWWGPLAKTNVQLYCSASWPGWQQKQTTYLSTESLQEPLVHDQPDRKIFQGQQSQRFLQAVKAMAGFILSKVHRTCLAWEMPHKPYDMFISLIILKAEGKQLVWYR